MEAILLFLLFIYLGSAILSEPEKATLLDFYNLDGGVNWKNASNWLKGDPCVNKWEGVICNPENTHIIEFFPNTRHSGNELIGPIPESISNWKWVEHLYLSNDQTPSSLTGEIPSSLAQLQKLKCFYVSHGDLTGSLDVFGSIPSLVGLFVRVNRFKTEFPDLSKLSNLSYLWFDTNFISGNLSSIANNKVLHTLRGFINEISGDIPENLCNIHTCSLQLNNFNCPLPVKKCCGVTECDSNSKWRQNIKISPIPLGNDGVCHPQ